jgi:uncharacterized phiE125 gp8 family phage protein
MKIDPLIVTPGSVDEAKTYLRIENEEEDGVIAALLAATLRLAEQMVGQMLIIREVSERLPVSSAWQRLGTGPVIAIESVTGIPAEGASFALPVSAYALDIDGGGDGWVRVIQPGSAGRIDIVYASGLAAGWDSLPDGLRLGTLRLLAHLYSHRDAAGDEGPPPAVAALFRPYRRMVLS